jgi:hypothetical protein
MVVSTVLMTAAVVMTCFESKCHLYQPADAKEAKQLG